MEVTTKMMLYIKTMIYISNLVKIVKEVKTKLKVLSLPSLQFERLASSCTKSDIDLNSCVIISLRTFLSLQLKSNWKIGIFSSDNQCFSRYLNILVSQNVSNDTSILSDVLFDNILRKASPTNTNSIRIELVINRDASHRMQAIWNQYMDENLKYSQLSNMPAVAQEVKLSLMDSFDYQYHTELETLLHYYFGSGKCLCEGEIINLSLPNGFSSLFKRQKSLIPPQCLKLYVVSIKSKRKCFGSLVINTDTSLYLVKHTVTMTGNLTHLDSETISPCIKHSFEKTRRAIDGFHIFWARNNSFEDSKTDNMCESLSKLNSSSFVLLIGPSGSGKTSVIHLCSKFFNNNVKWIQAWELKGDTSHATEMKIQQAFYNIPPHTLVAILKIGILSKDKEGNIDPRVSFTLKEEFQKLLVGKCFIIATAHCKSELSEDIWSLFTYHEVIPLPSGETRLATLEYLLDSICCNYTLKDKDVLLKILSHRTAGFLLKDLEELITRTLRYSRMAHCITTNNVSINKELQHGDFIRALDEMQKERSNLLGLPSIPKVHWEDIGGLDEAKREIINTIQLPIKHPHLVSKGMRRSGIILYGPPGTGKTLLAKSIAHECGLNFMSVKGPELLNMYVGQSEENVREVFSSAKTASPCIIFFDELDSLAPNRGHSGDSGGVMDRIVSSLLAELDGISSSSDVFVLAATNRPDLLDPALLRPGRFEKLIYLGIPKEEKERLKILKAVSSKVPLHKDVSLERILKHFPINMTGADFAALTTDAFYIAVKRCIKENDEPIEKQQVSVMEEDFIEVAAKLLPSISLAEMKKYENMHKNVQS